MDVRRAVGGGGVIFQARDRRTFAYWGKVAVTERKSARHFRFYAKQWQVELCIGDTCYYGGLMALTKPSGMRHLKVA